MDNKDSPLKLTERLQFWYQHYLRGEGEFEDSLKPVAVIENVEQFWAFYQHFKRPTDLPVGSYIYLFKENVKPVWEDEHNENGGAFILRFEKSKCNRLWEDILLGYVSASAEILAEVNGVRLKVKKDFAEVDFWVANLDDEEIVENARKWIVSITSL